MQAGGKCDQRGSTVVTGVVISPRACSGCNRSSASPPPVQSPTRASPASPPRWCPSPRSGPCSPSRPGGNTSSTTFGLFRYFLLAIPLVVCICASVLDAHRHSAGHRGARSLCQPARRGAGLRVDRRRFPGDHARDAQRTHRRIATPSRLQLAVAPRRVSRLQELPRPADDGQRAAAGRLPRPPAAPRRLGPDGHVEHVGCLAQFGQPKTVRHHQRLRLQSRTQPALGQRNPVSRSQQFADQPRQPT